MFNDKNECLYFDGGYCSHILAAEPFLCEEKSCPILHPANISPKFYDYEAVFNDGVCLVEKSSQGKYRFTFL